MEKTTRLFLSLAVVGCLATACGGDDHDHDDHDGTAGMGGAPGTGGTMDTDAGTAGTPATPDVDAGPADGLVLPEDDANPPGDAPTAPTATLGRLLVGDGNRENPRFLIVDLDDGSTVATFPAFSSVTGHASGSRAGLVWARQQNANLVEVVTSGVALVGDLLVKSQPQILGQRLEGARPTHWVYNDDWVVSFNDGDGTFDLVLESTLLTDRPIVRRATSGKAHHGVAVVSHGNVFTSLASPDEGSSARIGVSRRFIVTPDAEADRTEDCPGLHGEASNEEIVAFGCSDGIILAERKDGQFAFRKLAPPSTSPSAIGTVRLQEGVPRLIGWGGGRNGFVVIPYREADPSWTEVDIGMVNRGAFIEHTGKHLVLLANDGSLRRFDVMTGAPVGTPLAVIEAWPTSGLPAGIPGPNLALHEDMAYIADPRNGTIVEVDIAAWAKKRTFTVGGWPTGLAAFGRWSAGMP